MPDKDAERYLSLCFIDNTSAVSRSCSLPTEIGLPAEYSSNTLAADVTLFVRSCIHYLETRRAERAPRPYDIAMHETKPSELPRFDYIELYPGTTGEKYIVRLRDDHSGYSTLYMAEINLHRNGRSFFTRLMR